MPRLTWPGQALLGVAQWSFQGLTAWTMHQSRCGSIGLRMFCGGPLASCCRVLGTENARRWCIDKVLKSGCVHVFFWTPCFRICRICRRVYPEIQCWPCLDTPTESFQLRRSWHMQNSPWPCFLEFHKGGKLPQVQGTFSPVVGYTYNKHTATARVFQPSVKDFYVRLYH